MLGFLVEGAVTYGPTILACIGAAAVARKVYDSVDLSATGERISKTLLTVPIFERLPIIGPHIIREKAALCKEKVGLIKSALETRGIGTSPDELGCHRAAGRTISELSPMLPTGRFSLEEIADVLGIDRYTLAAFRRAAEIRVEKEIREDSFASGAIYTRDQDLYTLCMMVDSKYSYSNHMHSDMWPELLEYRAQLINWIGNLLHAPKDQPVQGIATSGGTLSIFESVNAHLQLYLDKHPKADRANLAVVGSIDTHEAFSKACKRLGIRYIQAPVTQDRQVDIRAMERECKRFDGPVPIMLVASYISFPYGTCDNVQEISELASSLGAGCHVDMCLGSIYAADLDGTKKDFVFDNPGVTAVSFDTHKFCEVDKGVEGSSVIIFRDSTLKKAAAHSGVDWEGGAYATGYAPGSVGGSGIAKAYFTMLLVGLEEYKLRRDTVLEVTRKITNRVRGAIRIFISDGMVAEDDFFVVGEPKHAVVGFSGKLAHAVGNLLKHKSYEPGSKEFVALGFSEEEPTDVQKWLAGKPKFEVNDLKGGFHQCTTMAYATDPRFADSFITCLLHAIHICKEKPDFVQSNSTAAFYCTAAKVPSVAKWALHDLAKEYTRLEGLTEDQLVCEYMREIKECEQAGPHRVDRKLRAN